MKLSEEILLVAENNGETYRNPSAAIELAFVQVMANRQREAIEEFEEIKTELRKTLSRKWSK